MANFITDFVEKKLAEPADSRAYQHTGERDLGKGLLAGLAAGIAATAAKTLAERVYPPRTHGEPEPPDVMVEKIVGHPVDERTGAIAKETIHWAFGMLAGATYGAIAEYYPAITARDGANFGMSLMALTHEGVLPALGLSAEPANQTTREKASEIATHVVFGIVAETVRRSVRKSL